MTGFEDKDIRTVGVEVASEAFTFMRDDTKDMSECEAISCVVNERAYDEPEIINVLQMPEFIRGLKAGIEINRYALERY